MSVRQCSEVNSPAGQDGINKRPEPSKVLDIDPKDPEGYRMSRAQHREVNEDAPMHR